MLFPDKKVLCILMKWYYGNPLMGPSDDELILGKAFEALVGTVDFFWEDLYFNDNNKLQVELIKKVEKEKPDLVFYIAFRDEFKASTFKEINKITQTLGWFGDDQWRFDDYSSIMALNYTYVCTTDLWSIPKYEKIGIKPILTQWAAHKFAENIGPLKKEEKYEYDVSFVGGINDYRIWFVEKLLKKGISVECFGLGWKNGKITYEQMNQIFRKTKINLNISNSVSTDIRVTLSSLKNLYHFFKAPKRMEQMKARNFEIPLAGGFQLANYVLGIENYLSIGKEIALYNTVEECLLQISYYLRNEDIRKDIIIKSHLKVINEHTYYHRIKEILKKIWKK